MSDGRLRIVSPEGFPPAKGYANGVVTTGALLHVGGQIGWHGDGSFASDELTDQFGVALDNVISVVRAAGAEPSDIARMTIYVTDLEAYRGAQKPLGAVWRARMGRHYPAMALLGVAGLVEPRAKVEIEAVAVMPAARPSDQDE